MSLLKSDFCRSAKNSSTNALISSTVANCCLPRYFFICGNRWKSDGVKSCEPDHTPIYWFLHLQWYSYGAEYYFDERWFFFYSTNIVLSCIFHLVCPIINQHAILSINKIDTKVFPPNLTDFAFFGSGESWCFQCFNCRFDSCMQLSARVSSVVLNQYIKSVAFFKNMLTFVHTFAVWFVFD